MNYEPKPGSVPYRAIAYLQRQAPGAEVKTSVLAEAIGAPPASMNTCMEPARAAGLVFARQRDPHARSPMWWSLTDHSNSVPAAKKPAPQAWEPRKAAGLDDALAQIKADDIEIPRFGAPTPRGTAATPGDRDDNEGDGGRACRLAGGSDDGGSGEDRGRGVRSRAGGEDHGAAAHHAGLLRAQHTRTAHQGTAESTGDAGLNSTARDAGQCTDGEAAQAVHNDSPGPDAASTPTNGRHPARCTDTPEPGPQQVLKAEPATADATDRGDPDTASPGGGPTGVGQPAAAGPAVAISTRLLSGLLAMASVNLDGRTPEQIVEAARGEPAVGAAAPEGLPLAGKTATLSMTGEIAVVAECGTVILFDAQRARQLLAFFAGRAA